MVWTKEQRKERHKLAMREYRKTEKYRDYDRDYARQWRKTHKVRKYSIKVTSLGIVKESNFSIPVEPLSIAKEEKVSLP